MARFGTQTTTVVPRGRVRRPDQEMVMAKITVHVVAWGAGWAVEQTGEQLSTHVTRTEAETIAREHARRIDAIVIIHGRSGEVPQRDQDG
jgi:hypothetical protein